MDSDGVYVVVGAALRVYFRREVRSREARHTVHGVAALVKPVLPAGGMLVVDKMATPKILHVKPEEVLAVVSGSMEIVPFTSLPEWRAEDGEVCKPLRIGLSGHLAWHHLTYQGGMQVARDLLARMK